MDRLHVIISNVDDHCISHPIACADTKIRAKLENINGLLVDCYSEIGRKDHEAKGYGMKEVDISTNHPESANGRMHTLGFRKYHKIGRNGRRRHVFVKGDLELEINSYDRVMEYYEANKNPTGNS